MQINELFFLLDPTHESYAKLHDAKIISNWKIVVHISFYLTGESSNYMLQIEN